MGRRADRQIKLDRRKPPSKSRMSLRFDIAHMKGPKLPCKLACDRKAAPRRIRLTFSQELLLQAGEVIG